MCFRNDHIFPPLSRLTSICGHSFARNWQLFFLNQRKGENYGRKYFMINLHERMLRNPAGIKPATSLTRIWQSHRGHLWCIMIWYVYDPLQISNFKPWFNRNMILVSVLSISIADQAMVLTLTVLSGLIQQTTHWWYFSYLSLKTGFDISCKLLETICMKCPIPFSGKNEKLYFKMSSSELFTRSMY